MGSGTALEASLPARWGRFQRWKNTLLYLGIRIAGGLMRRLPFWFARGVAKCLGWLASWVAVGEARRADEQLRWAFPEWNDGHRRRIVRGVFVHLAQSAAEAAHLPRWQQGKHALRLDEAQRELCRTLFAHGKGVVAVTGHIGNWELLAQVVAAEFPTTTVAKPLYDPRLTRWVHRERTAGGLKIAWRGRFGGIRDLLRALREKEMVSVLIDQDTRVHGVFVPFFGRLAYTPTAAAALAVRTGAPVLMAWIHRDGNEHRIHMESLAMEPSGDRGRDVERLTALMTERLEEAIRQAPEQWVWFHHRWKTRPQGLGAAGQG